MRAGLSVQGGPTEVDGYIGAFNLFEGCFVYTVHFPAKGTWQGLAQTATEQQRCNSVYSMLYHGMDVPKYLHEKEFYHFRSARAKLACLKC